MAASTGIILDWVATPMQQKFFGGKEIQDKPKGKTRIDPLFHNDDITCLKISNDRTLVASGQVGSEPWVFVWSSVDGSLKSRFQL